MSKADDNKAIVGRWFSEFWGSTWNPGIVVGVAGALAVSRLLQQALFEVDATSPLVYLALSVFLLVVTECASWFPSRRATRIDPVIALRAE